jgi:hypothetical protein
MPDGEKMGSGLDRRSAHSAIPQPNLDATAYAPDSFAWRLLSAGEAPNEYKSF